jgi:hypothetical protein
MTCAFLIPDAPRLRLQTSWSSLIETVAPRKGGVVARIRQQRELGSGNADALREDFPTPLPQVA